MTAPADGMDPRPPDPLPPRSDALSRWPMLVSFDIDCGELVPGHRFIARGVADKTHQGEKRASLEYELVPGLTPQEVAERRLFPFIAGVRFRPDVGEVPSGDSGAIAPPEGGPSTHGSRGDYPLHDDARVLTFTLSRKSFERGAPTPAGNLIVDLVERTARWVPRL